MNVWKILSKVLIASNFNLWIEMSFRILRSIGVQRGKTIKLMQKGFIDMQRKTKRKLSLYKAPKKSLEKIRALLALRERW